MARTTLLERFAVPLSGVSAATFAALSALRRARVFHPVGRAFSGVLTFTEAARRWLPRELTNPLRHDVIVRFSRGSGVPEPLPDVLGMAVKIESAYDDGRDQDWLFVTSGRNPVARHTLIPTQDFLARPYSTVLPYRIDGQLVTFGADAIDPGEAKSFDQLAELVTRGLSFDFTVAVQGKAHIPIGTLEVDGSWEGDDQPLRFNPWNSSRELEPAGALNELRRSAYRASQRTRPDA